MIPTSKRRSAARNAQSAGQHAVKAAGDLGSAARRFASAGALYAGSQARQTSKSLGASPAAKQVRGKARDVGATAGRTANRWRKRGRRAVTLGLVAGVAVVARQVRSQPVPPDVGDE